MVVAVYKYLDAVQTGGDDKKLRCDIVPLHKEKQWLRRLVLQTLPVKIKL